MNIYVLLITAILNMLLAVVVLFHNPKNKGNVSLSAIVFFVVLWSLAIFFFWQARSVSFALFWGRNASIFASAIPPLFVYFTFVFPRKQKVSLSLVAFLIFAVVVQVFLISFDLVVADVVVSSYGYGLVVGPAFLFFSLYFVFFMLWAFINLLVSANHYRGIVHSQVIFVLFGSILGTFFPVITNLVLPFLGITYFTQFGPIFTLMMVSLMSYAILRHRLLDISVVIRKGLAYSILTALLSGFIVLMILLGEQFFRGIVGYSSIWAIVISVFVVALVFQPLRDKTQRWVDRLFFKGKYDYKEAVGELSKMSASAKSLAELLGMVKPNILAVFKAKECSVFVLEEGKKRFCRK